SFVRPSAVRSSSGGGWTLFPTLGGEVALYDRCGGRELRRRRRRRRQRGERRRAQARRRPCPCPPPPGGQERREPGDSRSTAGLRALGEPRRLGLPDRPAAGLRGSPALLAARQGARRLERAQRDDLHPRPPERLRSLGLPRQRRLVVRRRP